MENSGDELNADCVHHHPPPLALAVRFPPLHPTEQNRSSAVNSQTASILFMDDLTRYPDYHSPGPNPKGGWSRLFAAIDRIPVLGVLRRAFWNYIVHQSPNNAGHVAFSAVLALFPFLLFLSNATLPLGEQPGAVLDLSRMVLDYAPTAVADALLPAIEQALAAGSKMVLTIGLLGTLWAASSGAQAARMALNRAYDVKEGLTFWKARIKVLWFTIAGTVAIVLAFSSVVVLPYLWQALDATIGMGGPASGWIWIGARYGVAAVVLMMLYLACYAWLPDLSLYRRTIIPGAIAGVILWLGFAALLSWTLRSVAQLTPIYGSFAGVAATLIFFYVSAATIIFSAEVNGIIQNEKRRT
jgi:membrane protein